MHYSFIVISLLILMLTGTLRARAVIHNHSAVSLKTAHRHMRELAPLALLGLVGVAGLVLIQSYTRLTWFLPVWLDVVSRPVIWLCSGGLFAYIFTIGICIAWHASDPERVKLLFVALALGGALCFRYTVTFRPLHVLLQHESATTPFVRQSSMASCAAASAANIVRFLGGEADEPEMARLAGTTQLGTSDGQAMFALRKKGVATRKREFTLAELANAQHPFLLLVEYPGMGPDSHAIIAVPGADGVAIVDPLNGTPRALSNGGIRYAWDGHAVECWLP